MKEMFVHHRTKSFILKETERGEADKILAVFAEDFGRIDVLARAVRKMQSKLRGGVPLFSLCEIEFIQGRAYKTLTDAVLINDFANIKKDLARLRIAYQIADVFDRLIKPPQQDEKIWLLLGEVFKELNRLQITPKTASLTGQADYRLQLVYFYFLWNLLSILGYCPELYYCLVCKKKLKPENLLFSFKGGVICSVCHSQDAQSLSVEVNTIKILREILKRNSQALSKLKIKPELYDDLKKVSSFYLNFLLNWGF